MARLVLEIIPQSSHLGEGRDQIGHPRREERESFVIQRRGTDLLQQSLLWNVPEALLVPADVEHHKPGNVRKLVLGGTFDEGVCESSVGGTSSMSARDETVPPRSP